ncbi:MULTISPECIES: hypothetical protein [Pseudomonas]|uniref:hypothetical protein n=1 Tax=Pseudomonas TaxID=286 RepID=UPI0011AF481A|nr:MULTISPECIES: hypothetical protein [Pseudomonas]
MARFKIGEKVFVPCSRIKGMDDLPSVFWPTTVRSVKGRSITVDLRGGVESEEIGSSLCHKNLGLLILTVGDLKTEPTLLDPLAKSILQYCRLLVPDDYIRAYKIRSLEELKTVWSTEQDNCSHLIIIGHGSQAGIDFANNGWCNPAQIEDAIGPLKSLKKVAISLCCKTGYKSVGGKLSDIDVFSHFIAPFHSVHGAVASQFTQSFLAFHLLEGETTKVAFKHASNSTPGSISFRLWEKGKLTAGPK